MDETCIPFDKIFLNTTESIIIIARGGHRISAGGGARFFRYAKIFK